MISHALNAFIKLLIVFSPLLASADSLLRINGSLESTDSRQEYTFTGTAENIDKYGFTDWQIKDITRAFSWGFTVRAPGGDKSCKRGQYLISAQALKNYFNGKESPPGGMPIISLRGGVCSE